MNTSTIINEVGAVLRAETQSNCVGLWTVLWEIKQRLPANTPDDARVLTLSAVREALKEGGVVPGEFVDRDEEHLVFVPWNLTTDEALARLEQDWSSLGREPNLGEIAWFVAPSLLPLTALKRPMGRDWKPKVSPKTTPT